MSYHGFGIVHAWRPTTSLGSGRACVYLKVVSTHPTNTISRPRLASHLTCPAISSLLVPKTLIIMSNEKPCIIDGVLNDEQSSPTGSNPQEQSSTASPPAGAAVEQGGANGPSSSSPSRTAARRRPRRTKSIETLSRKLSSASLGSLVNAYLRRNISMPKMAKREATSRDVSARSRRSVEGVTEEEDDSDNTDALYI